MESQKSTVTRQRPVNKIRGIVFSAQSIPMAAHAAMEYVMLSLSKNYTATEEQCFLRYPCRDVINRTVQEYCWGLVVVMLLATGS
jgi:hypothetical protein